MLLSKLNQIILAQTELSKSSFDVTHFMKLIVQEVQKLTLADGVVVELVDHNEMVYEAASGSLEMHIGMRLAKKGSISGLSVDQKMILMCEDTETDPRVNIAACRRVRARSMVVAPLFHQGVAIGVIKILSEKPRAFDESHIATLQMMAGMIGSALANQLFHDETMKLLSEKTKALDELKVAEEKLLHLANYDELTELPNRNLFSIQFGKIIEEVKRYHKRCAVCFLDVDHFKQINDTLGHDAGDELLKKFAERIKKSIRTTDFAARMGGDEFIVLLGEIKSEKDIVTFCTHFLREIRAPFLIAEKTLSVTTSVGIAIIDAYHCEKNTVLKKADRALYQSKQAGRDQFYIFKESV